MTTNNNDWAGNSMSAFVTNGDSSHSETIRQQHDFYATPPAAVDALISAYQLPEIILEPCCGSGCISTTLERSGRTVISEDLYNQGFGVHGVDFLQRDAMPSGCRCIVTNFPYNQVLPMTLHALDLLPVGGVLASFAKTTFLEGQKRYELLFSNNPPKHVFQFVRRVNCGKNGFFSGESSAVSYAWFVWEKSYIGPPIVSWLT